MDNGQIIDDVAPVARLYRAYCEAEARHELGEISALDLDLELIELLEQVDRLTQRYEAATGQRTEEVELSDGLTIVRVIAGGIEHVTVEAAPR